MERKRVICYKFNTNLIKSKPTVVYHLLDVSIRDIIDPRINRSRDYVRVRQIGIDHISVIKSFHCCSVALSGRYTFIDVNA
jgi:hypothetical protein